MAAKVKGKKTKRRRGSQPTMTTATSSKGSKPTTRRPDGRARPHTHPSQLPNNDAIRRAPGFVIRAKKTVIDAITLLAEERGVSRNTLVVELLTKAIEESSDEK